MTGNRVRRSRRQILAGTGAALVAGLAGCSGGDGSGGNGNGNGNGNGDGSNGDENGDNGMEDDRTEDAEEVNVEANNFNPQIMELEPGTTVRWEHRGATHTVTFYHEDNERQQRVPEGVEAVDEDINPGSEFYEFTFEEPGVYDYFCQEHPEQMIGSIIVAGNDDPNQPGLQEPGEEFEPFAAQEIRSLNDEARDILGI